MAVLEQEQLHQDRRYYAAEILSKLNAKLAIPTLIAVLKEQCQKNYLSPNDLSRGCCGTAILNVSLEHYLGKGLQKAIIKSLGNMGKDAISGLPIIEKMQNEKHEDVRNAVLQAIQKIKR
ncbi:hypothetical protein [Candidatus Uabimicrobium sp. HlEnr_7]|uniref:hypothetical protein n=1 Tax=Candidatus Uabimicrobium helgolandensis TaxID=3095367 RepID=UPI00355912DA